MEIIIGIDMGTSTTKMVAYTIEQKLIGTMQFEVEDNIENQVGVFISKYNVEKDNIIKIVLTGVRASYVEGEILNKPTVKIDEFTAIGKGLLNAVKKEKALIISMGTGTAYVRVEGGKIEHIGGTGLGGGTLLNLCNELTDTKNFQEIVDLAKDGNVENVNLLIRDITKEKIPTLPDNFTAANFARIKENATKADLALGIIYMVFETLAMLAVFATRNDTIKDVVLIGSVTKFPQTEEIFDNIHKLYKINFIIPENSAFITACGAALTLD